MITVVIITGPSGVGKGTVVSCLLADSSLKAVKVPRHTNRKPRLKEKEGETHCFVSTEQFRQFVSEGAFLDWHQAGGHLYGTMIDSYRDSMVLGEVILFDVGVASAVQLQSSPVFQGIKLIPVILSPVERTLLSSDEGMNQALGILKNRILKRSSGESTEEMGDRLKQAKEDLGQAQFFANVIVCKEGFPQEAVDEVKKLIVQKQ